MLNKAHAIQDQLIAWRRDFHMYPELGFQEMRTSEKIAQVLNEMGCRVKQGVGRTGVVAELGLGTPVIALRADMDALPVLEANSVPYASKNPGVMHACGHDSHSAILLGVAKLLKMESFHGTVRFLFQPSEETADEEGQSGAMRMASAGVMDGVDIVLALHVDPYTAVGDIQVDLGPFSGGVDSWFGSILGWGGHGARPHETVDPIYITAHVIFALMAIPSRKLNPFDPAVVGIGSIHGGQAENVIPERVDLTGTLRYTEPRVQDQIQTEIKRCFDLARDLGGDYQLRFEIGSPPMVNHPDAVALIHQAAAGLLGEQHILPPTKSLGAEDFGCFSSLAPGAMFSLGARIEGNPRIGHSSHFDIDENALPIGTAILAECVKQFFKEKGRAS